MYRRDVFRAGAAGVTAVGLPTGVAGCVADVGSDAASDADGTAEFEPLGRLPLSAAHEVVVDDAGETAYVAAGTGFYLVDLTDPAAPTVRAERFDLLATHESGPMELIWDCAVDGDDLLVVGAAQARSRMVDAALHYDVSDPTEPELLAVHETDYPIHNGDIADRVAYLTGNTVGENPVVVVDLDPEGETAPREIARWSVVDDDPEWAAVSSALRPIHDVSIHDEILYAAYWDAGTHLLDVSDPTDPRHLAGVGPYEPADLADLTNREVQREMTVPPGNHHFAAPNEDGTLLAVNVESWGTEVDGELVGGPGGVRLYDIADATAPELLVTIDAPATPDTTYDGVWTTSHNFELRGDRLYTSWYEGGVKLHDVSDPAAPEEIAWWRDPANASFWTAQVGVAGDFFVATSTDHRPTEPALYTFPDRAGEQADPPSMEAALETDDPDGDEAGDGTPADGTPTDEAPADETPVDGTPVDEPDPEATDDDTPGFGVAAGVLGVGAAGIAAWLRRPDRE